MKSNSIKILFAVSLLIMSSCGTKETESQTKKASIAVVINNNNTATTQKSIYSSGKIEAGQSAILSTRLMGNITKIHKEIGDPISKNELLVSINSNDLLAKKAQISAQINAAETAFNNSNKDLNRYTSLFKTESISQKELDNITLQYQAAKANLIAAKAMKQELNAQLEYTQIRAPFNGFITQKFLKEGNMANPGMPIISIENSEKMQIKTLITASNIHKISKASKVSVSIPSINKNIEGKIIAISNSSTNTGGQFSVKIELNNTSKEIFSGMYANIVIETNETISNAVWIPKSAIVTRGQLSGIYTISTNNTAILRWLRLGKTKDNRVEVLSGLNASEKYIISAKGKLFNGVAVNIQ